MGKNQKAARKVMKVLYVGCYRDGTGWGNAAIDYILSMDQAGIDVVPRPLRLDKTNGHIPKRIEELEKKDSSGADVCIQHVLPHLMEYNPNFKKNIALYATETTNFKDSGWARNINMLDEAWVINNQMFHASKDSGVDIPIKVVPHATDFSKFERSYEKINIPNVEDNFVFYTIADLNRRKNLEALIKAFHMEFEPDEPASLLIKTSQYGLTPDETARKLRDVSNAIKIGLKKFSSLEDYKEDLMITDYLSSEDINRLHATGDCFVIPSHGEAWCIPAFDAMGFGKTPICTNIGGMKDFIGNGGFLVEGNMEPVFGMTRTFKRLFTCNEDWCSVSVRGLMEAMRHVYENQEKLKNMKSEGLSQAYKYSYSKIGNLIKDLLHAN